jgi:hypothetical protein
MDILNLLPAIWAARHTELVPFLMVYSLLAVAVIILLTEIHQVWYFRQLRRRAQRELAQERRRRTVVRDFHKEVQAWQDAVQILDRRHG